ncbi:MAG: hypothetical protein MI757_23235, partial [Pirellulales bacterium]|nr:hypothetical protein [Pirellulales bacterium]
FFESSHVLDSPVGMRKERATRAQYKRTVVPKMFPNGCVPVGFWEHGPQAMLRKLLGCND